MTAETIIETTIGLWDSTSVLGLSRPTVLAAEIVKALSAEGYVITPPLPGPVPQCQGLTKVGTRCSHPGNSRPGLCPLHDPDSPWARQNLGSGGQADLRARPDIQDALNGVKP